MSTKCSKLPKGCAFENWIKIREKSTKERPGGVALDAHRRHLGFICISYAVLRQFLVCLISNLAQIRQYAASI
jgi:hypothetical protein